MPLRPKWLKTSLILTQLFKPKNKSKISETEEV
jgi:hypothetical protein